jgi:C-terminal processing protease CtpA/Prc
MNWRVVAVLAWSAVLSVRAIGQAPASAPTSAPASRPLLREDMTADLDDAAAIVKRTWSYYDDKSERFGVDLEAVVARLKEELPARPTRDDFADAVDRFVAALKDGHAWGDVPGRSPPPYLRAPFSVVDAAEGVIVADVEPSVVGADAPRRGDLLLEVDGEPLERRIERRLARVAASTDGARRRFALTGALKTSARSMTVAYERDGARRTTTLATTGAATPRRAPYLWSEAAPDVGLLSIRTFMSSNQAAWRKARPEERDGLLAEAKAELDALFVRAAAFRALIIDLRGNQGGTDLLGIHAAERLIPEKFVYFELQARYSPEAAAFFGLGQPSKGWGFRGGTKYGGRKDMKTFAGRLVLLVDELTFSTADNFAACIADHRKDCTIVGRPTHGGTGCPAPVVFLPRSGAKITLCTQKVFRPSGELIEGRGTVPSLLVRPTREDVRSGRDPDLAAAMKLFE